MKRKTWAVTCLCAAALSLSGCGQVTELTAQEEDVIAEYAAKTLLNYDTGYNSRYKTDAMTQAKADAKNNADKSEQPKESKTPQATAKVKETATPTPEPVSTPEATPTPEPTPTPEVTVSEEPVQVPQTTIAENRMSPSEVGKLLGMEGVEVSYSGFEAVDTYPVVPDDQLAFTMNASQGAKLIVVKFSLVNSTQKDINCNVAGQNIKFQMRFNQADYVGVQKTLLTDDFALLNCVLKPGESKQVVVISQVAAGYETTISSVDLIARVGGENTLINLQ